MERNEIKEANRRAMPRFLLLVVICGLIGGVAGYVSGRYGLDALAEEIKALGAIFGTRVAPWLMLAEAIAVPAVCVPIFRSAKRLFSDWDGADEEIYGAVEKKLSIITWFTGAALVLSYFLIAASYSGGFSMFDDRETTVLFFVTIAAFFGIIVEAILLQQKCVDTAKMMNPEKVGSIYEMNFQKKWMDSCDEAEKLVIGKCALKAYAATNNVCTALAIVLAVGALVLDIGFLPSFSVCLIWLVNLSAYCKEAMKFAKAGNKIS